MSTVDRRRALYVSVLEREAAEKRALWAAGASSDAALARRLQDSAYEAATRKKKRRK